MAVNLEIIVAILDTQATEVRRFHISRVLEILQEIKFRLLCLNYPDVKHKKIQKKEHHLYGSSVGSHCYYTIEYFRKEICAGHLCKYVQLTQQVKKCVSTWQNLYFDLVYFYHAFKLMKMFYNITAQKVNFSIRKLLIWSHLLKKFVKKNLIFFLQCFLHMHTLDGCMLRFQRLVYLNHLISQTFLAVVYLNNGNTNNIWNFFKVNNKDI